MGGRRAADQRRLGELLTLCYHAHSTAAPASVWRLLAEPAQWSRWAPHIRGTRGLGDPEVRPVTPSAGGSEIRIEITAPRAIEAGMRLTYGPLVELLLRNLARVAGR